MHFVHARSGPGAWARDVQRNMDSSRLYALIPAYQVIRQRRTSTPLAGSLERPSNPENPACPVGGNHRTGVNPV